jgi:hypothetical protein
MTFCTCAVTSNVTRDPAVAVTDAYEQLPSTMSTPGFSHAVPLLRCLQVTLHSSKDTGIVHAARRRVSAFPPLTVSTSLADEIFAFGWTLVSVSNVSAARLV